MGADSRESRCSDVADRPFDVVIAGGGITGAAIFARLARDGYRVLLIDKGDFGSATSQESAMMIWGGLLYLTRFDFRTVYNLSRSRDQLLERYPDAVRAQYFHYLPLKEGWQARPLVKGLFDFYRVLGGLRRQPNFIESRFAEEAFVATSRYRGSVAYEEAMLANSDARFVLDLVRSHDTPTSIPLNHVSLEEGEYDPSRRLWHLGLRDQFTGGELEVRARLVINATGPHVDRINRLFSVSSPYKHVLSKGVFLSFARPPEHNAPLIFELGSNRDVLTFVPWGPVSFWGPTEVAIHDLDEASEPKDAEVSFLLEHANRSLNYPISAREIISYRCGVRPLAVSVDYQAEKYPLELSRHHRSHVIRERPWISIYGGKFTSSIDMSDQVGGHVAALLGKPATTPVFAATLPSPPLDMAFPGLPGRFPSIAHCVEHEYCLTLDDYLRRRTNIAQWVPRNGLGRKNEHLSIIEQLAAQLPHAAADDVAGSVERYVAVTHRVFDRLTGAGEVTKQ